MNSKTRNPDDVIKELIEFWKNIIPKKCSTHRIFIFKILNKLSKILWEKIMNGEYFLKLFLGVLIAVSIVAVPILFSVWWVYKRSKKILGETEEKTELKGKGNEISEEVKWWKNPLKYLIHGITFSILFLILVIIWAFIFAFLVTIGFILGFIIGIGLLFLIVGYINSFLTDLLWFPVKTSFWSTLFHGFALFIVLLIVGVIFVLIPNMAFPSITTRIITFIVETFLNGLAGKTIAGGWKEEVGTS